MEYEVKTCFIISGAPNADLEYIKNIIDKNGFIIAADSGYNVLKSLNIKPDVLIADFDSSKPPETEANVITFPVEKDATDTFNCVKYAVENGFNRIVILNALGGRFDHSYSNVLCLDYCKNHGVDCIIQDSKNRLSLITNKKTVKKEYQWFSLFAFLEDCTGVTIDGAHYGASFFNKTALDIKQGDQFAQSNFVEKDECIITLKSGTLLLSESND